MYLQALSCQYDGYGIKSILQNPDVCNRKMTCDQDVFYKWGSWFKPLKAGLSKLLYVVLKLDQSEQSNLSLISHTCAQACSDSKSELLLWMYTWVCIPMCCVVFMINMWTPHQFSRRERVCMCWSQPLQSAEAPLWFPGFVKALLQMCARWGHSRASLKTSTDVRLTWSEKQRGEEVRQTLWPGNGLVC